MKGIPFNPNDPEVSGPDIFKKLVPLEAHKASSLYRFINRVFDFSAVAVFVAVTSQFLVWFIL